MRVFGIGPTELLLICVIVVIAVVNWKRAERQGTRDDRPEVIRVVPALNPNFPPAEANRQTSETYPRWFNEFLSANALDSQELAVTLQPFVSWIGGGDPAAVSPSTARQLLDYWSASEGPDQARSRALAMSRVYAYLIDRGLGIDSAMLPTLMNTDASPVAATVATARPVSAPHRAVRSAPQPVVNSVTWPESTRPSTTTKAVNPDVVARYVRWILGTLRKGDLTRDDLRHRRQRVGQDVFDRDAFDSALDGLIASRKVLLTDAGKLTTTRNASRTAPKATRTGASVPQSDGESHAVGTGTLDWTPISDLIRARPGDSSWRHALRLFGSSRKTLDRELGWSIAAMDAPDPAWFDKYGFEVGRRSDGAVASIAFEGLPVSEAEQAAFLEPLVDRCEDLAGSGREPVFELGWKGGDGKLTMTREGDLKMAVPYKPPSKEVSLSLAPEFVCAAALDLDLYYLSSANDAATQNRINDRAVQLSGAWLQAELSSEHESRRRVALHRALPFMKREAYDAVVEVLRPHVIRDCKDYVAWRALAASFWALGDYINAESAAGCALIGRPDDPNLQQILSSAHEKNAMTRRMGE